MRRHAGAAMCGGIVDRVRIRSMAKSHVTAEKAHDGGGVGLIDVCVEHMQALRIAP